MLQEFNKDFLWGVATSAYQIEGGYTQNRTQKNIWDSFCEVPGKIEKGHNGSDACMALDHLQQDVSLIQEMQFSSYRFSISWARFLGTQDENLKQGADYYLNLVKQLKKFDIRPMATLYHWDLPESLHQKGGWENPKSPEWFLSFTQKVLDLIGDYVDLWVTFNEPNIFIPYGYVSAIHAPGQTLEARAVFNIYHNVLKAHQLAYQEIKKRNPRAKIGMALAYEPLMPSDLSKQEALLQRALRVDQLPYKQNLETLFKSPALWSDPLVLNQYPEGLSNLYPEYLLDRPCKEAGLSDFLGLNIYTGYYVDLKNSSELEIIPYAFDFPHTPMDWPIEPNCLYWGPKTFATHYSDIPIYICENGRSNLNQAEIVTEQKVDDQNRVEYYQQHLSALLKAHQQHPQIQAYYAWSLMDNFEWAKGYDQRFGLIYVDFDHPEKKRWIKQSGDWFSRELKLWKKLHQ